ncbi:MAG: aquaporin [Bacteroidota bacterium]
MAIKKYLTEFIGTFFLVLSIGMSLGAGTDLAPFAMGFTLAAMMYMGYHISGAHFNPAFTLAVWIRGGISPQDGGLYWLSQILGGFAGGALAGLLVRADNFVFELKPAAGDILVEAFLVECLFTFALALLFLHATTSNHTQGNSFYGMAMGTGLIAAVLAGQTISGAVFNPAVGLGPNIIVASFSYLWLYAVAPLVGGALAGLVFRFQVAKGKP